MECACKDDRILAAVSRLRQAYGAERIAVADHWPDDVYAVGVESPDAPGVLAYLSVCERGDWYVALELPPGPAEVAGEMPYRDAGVRAGVSLDDVVEIVGRHLGLARAK